MKPNLGKLNLVKKTIARKKVVDAQVQVDALRKVSPEELYQRIACKAYELFVQRGYQHGYHQQDWQEAERLVKADLS